MNLDLPASYQALREKAAAFCDETWPPRGADAALPRREQEIRWTERAVAAQLLHRSVPTEYGGAGLGWDPLADATIEEVFLEKGAPFLANTPNGPRFLVPVLLECGTEAQRRKYIEPTLSGRFNWCQGYSEPGAGSDLAAIRSKAELVDDHWIINGQKIWTSLADQANMMFGLFRTEQDSDRYGGISFLLVPMDTPGLVVRPIKSIHGALEFCEVFFNDVRVPAENIVGERGGGWNVSRAVLKYERLQLTDSSYVRGQFEALLDLAKRTPRGAGRAIDDSHIRQRLVAVEGWVASQEYSVARILTALNRDREPEVAAELLTGKLLSTHTQEAIAQLGLDILGASSLCEPAEDELTTRQYMRRASSDGDWVNRYFASLATALGGGTSNIHRNIIGERLLHLPRDIRMPEAARKG